MRPANQRRNITMAVDQLAEPRNWLWFLDEADEARAGQMRLVAGSTARVPAVGEAQGPPVAIEGLFEVAGDGDVRVGAGTHLAEK